MKLFENSYGIWLWVTASMLLVSIPVAAQEGPRTLGFNEQFTLELAHSDPEAAAGVAAALPGDPDAAAAIQELTEAEQEPWAPHTLQITSGGRTVAGGFQQGGWVSPPIAVPAEGAEPFLGLAGSWDADTPDPHLIDIDFRTSTDGRIWGDWIHSGYDDHTKKDSDRYHSNLVFAGKETRYIQYRMSLQRNSDGESPVIRDLTLHFISPGATPEHIEAEISRHTPEQRKMRRQEALRGVTSPDADTGATQHAAPGVQTVTEPAPTTASDPAMTTASDPAMTTASDPAMTTVPDPSMTTASDVAVYPLPEYVDRTIWGEPLGLNNTAGRSVTSVSHLIVHHSAGETDESDFAAVVRSYWDFHVNGRGWADIGYNWLVDGNGVIYQGRAFNLDGNRDVIGAHFSGYNANTMGICVIGNYNTRMPTGDALFSLNEMLAWKASEREIDPLARAQHYSPGGNIFQISGHRDSGIYTDCPGHQMYNYLPEVRKGVVEVLDEFFTPVDYHIPQGDHELGFETLAEAINWINVVDELQSNIRFVITDDLDETGAEPALTRQFRQNTQFYIVPEEGSRPVITLDHPLIITSSFVTLDGLRENGGSGGAGGSGENGGNGGSNENGESNGTGLTFHYTGEEEHGSVILIASTSQNIQLRNLTFTRDADLLHVPTAIAMGSVTGEQGPVNLAITGNAIGTGEAQFDMGVRVTAGIPQNLSIDGNTMHTQAGAIHFASQGFDVDIRSNRLYTSGKGLGAASAMTLRGGRFTIESNVVTVREPSVNRGVITGVHLEQILDDYLLANNMIRITPVDDAAGLTGTVSGVYVDTDYRGTSGEVDLYHNSLHMEGNADVASAALRVTGSGGSGAALDVRNNIFVNAYGGNDSNDTGGNEGLDGTVADGNVAGGNVAGGNFVTGSNGPDGTVGLMFESNIAWSAEANNWHVAEGALLGYVYGSPLATIGELRTATGDDRAVSTAVTFAFEDDEPALLLAGDSKGDVTLTGRGVPDVVPFDILGNARHPVFPYMGAHEPEPTLAPTLVGDYHIPRGDHEKGYETLAEAFTDLNVNGAEGDFRFIIHEDLDETASQLQLMRDDLTSNTRMTLVPAASGITIRISHPVLIENTSFVTIDGGEDRNLRFQMEDADAVRAFWIVGASQFVTLLNLDIVHEFGTGTATVGVQVRRDDDATAAPQGIRLERLYIGTPDHPFRDGVRLWGTGDPLLRVQADVIRNWIFATHRGITTFYVDNNTYLNNIINITGHHADPAWYAGVYLAGARGTSVRGNQIWMSGMNASTPRYAAGVNINLNEGQHTIVNNMISVTDDFENYGSSQENRLYGVAFHREGEGERYNLFHNTIHLGKTGQTGQTAAIGWEEVEPGEDPATFYIINNLLSNRHEGASAHAWIWTTGEFRTVRNNNLDVAESAVIGLFEGEVAVTLSDWRELSGADLNSRDAYVHYRSARDLRLTPDSEGDNRLAGSFLPTVSTDIFGNARNPDAPYKGAWESLEHVLTDADRDEMATGLPGEFNLKQNYPNPFNPVTQIRYDLPRDADVRLEVFTVTGQRVATLVNGRQEAGSHTVAFDASRLASGVYIYRIQAGEFTMSRQMTFIK